MQKGQEGEALFKFRSRENFQEIRSQFCCNGGETPNKVSQCTVFPNDTERMFDIVQNSNENFHWSAILCGKLAPKQNGEKNASTGETRKRERESGSEKKT